MEHFADTMDEEDARRFFSPFNDLYYTRIARSMPKSLVTYSEDKQFYQLQGSNASTRDVPKLVKSSLVAYIGTVCHATDNQGKRAAYGVYFGPDSKYNTAGLIDGSQRQDVHRAAVEGLATAIKIVDDITEKDMSITEVMFACDSDYLVDTVVMREGFKREDKGTLESLRSKLDDMEYGDDGGIECRLWPLSTEENVEAIALAGSVLDTVTA